MTWLHLFLDVPRDRWDAALSFWPAVTGWTLSDTRGDDGQFATLLPHSGSAWVKLQAIDGPPRVHLDLDDTDRPAAHRCSVSAGAEDAWTYCGVPVMRSPGGLLFCHTLANEGTQRLDRSAHAILDQVCLDVPPRLWDAEAAFWPAVTGRRLTPGSHPDFARLLDADDPSGQPRVLLQRLHDDAATVTAHPDFAVHDRAGEQRRHVGLGAEVLAEHDGWTVLRAPSGHVYCLTARDPATGGPA